MRRNLFRAAMETAHQLRNRSNKLWNQPFTISPGWLWRLDLPTESAESVTSFPSCFATSQEFPSGSAGAQEGAGRRLGEAFPSKAGGLTWVLCFSSTPAKCPQSPITCSSRSPRLDHWTIEGERNISNPFHLHFPHGETEAQREPAIGG